MTTSKKISCGLRLCSGLCSGVCESKEFYAAQPNMMTRARLLARYGSNFQPELAAVHEQSQLVPLSQCKSLPLKCQHLSSELDEYVESLPSRRYSSFHCGQEPSTSHSRPEDLLQTTHGARKKEGYPLPDEIVDYFDLLAFRTSIFQNMQSRCPGASFAFVITKNGHYVSGGARGFSRGAAPYKEMTIHQPIQTASVSKLITAVAVLQAIENSSINLDDAIWPYFPSNWTNNGIFKGLGITFNNSLQYRVGLDSVSGLRYDFESTKAWITKGKLGNYEIVKSKIGQTRAYNNACFAWLRIALFYMTAPIESQSAMTLLAGINEGLFNALISKYYEAYVRQTVFTKDQWAYLRPRVDGFDSNSETLYYSYPHFNLDSGAPLGNQSLFAGGTGWFLSTYQLANFWAELQYGNLLLYSTRKKIFNYDSPKNAFVLEDNDIVDAKFGKKVFSKGGAYKLGCYTKIVQFPDGVQLTLMSNFDLYESTGDFADDGIYNSPNPRADIAIINAYKSAWKQEKIPDEP